jgi:hypothetical protein
MSDEVTNEQTAQTVDSVESTNSADVAMPSEAPEAPRNAVIASSVKDDNLAESEPNGQNSEPGQTGQIEAKSEQAQAPETPVGTGTGQMVVNEPLGSVDEPIATEPAPVSASAPTPTPAEPVSQPIQAARNLARELFAKAREAIQFRKRKKLDRVMTLFAKRTNITNNEVEKFLHVSDATAARYLEILVKENKIKQSGKTGKGVSYSKI